MVMVISMLMIFIAVSASNMLLQDVHMVKRLKYTAQAEYLAEAGINHALAWLNANGLSALNPASFSLTPPGGSGLDGTYTVTAKNDAAGNRVLLESVGTIQSVSRTVALEVRDTMPSCMNYILSANGDVLLKAGFVSLMDIEGDIHGNQSVQLSTGIFLGFMLVDGTATYTISQDDMVSIDVYIGYINAGGIDFWPGTHTKKDWQDNAVELPEFDYAYYKDQAQSSGLYYSGDQLFSSQSLNPGNGITYVEGTATFRGTCHVYGGLVADEIKIESYRSGWSVTKGKLYQHKQGEYNVICARSGNIEIGNQDGWVRRAGELHAEEALIYAGTDLISRAAGSIIYVTGVITASNAINLREYVAYVNYSHQMPSVKFGPDIPTFEIVSWNR